MHTSNIHEITKKAAVSIAVKIITGHLLRTIWYNISNIETGKIPISDGGQKPMRA